jgi:1-deoxy-D-xylulose-5-phosphate reductoisomerase
MKNLAVLGSTGSIGQSTLEVVKHHPDRLRVVALAAGKNRDKFLEQCRIFRPEFISLATREDLQWVLDALDYQPRSAPSDEGLLHCVEAEGVNTVVSAIVGASGLRSTEKALRHGHRVCLANKESLVVGGTLILEALRQGQGELLPIDSEHAALHQLLHGKDMTTIRTIRLTASGGPFREWSLAQMKKATVQEAINHPTWKMGPKITIDSATLMNKGLEVIEACHLFGLTPEQIGVTIHPQSQVHAMIEMHDGSFQMQASANDMRLPIQYALLYPDQIPSPANVFSWDQPRTWDFHPPDLNRFPCLRLAYQSLCTGQSASIILNAANEESVNAFLKSHITFGLIAECNEAMLDTFPLQQPENIDHVLEIDKEVRLYTQKWLEAHR